MKKDIYIDWIDKIESNIVAAFDKDFILLENGIFDGFDNYPFKINATTSIICTKGYAEGFINLKPFRLEANSIGTILPGQILEKTYVSEDFFGYVIIMSNKFTNNLITNATERLPLILSVSRNPILNVNDRKLSAAIGLFNILKETMQNTNNAYRMQVLTHLVLAYCYSMFFYQPIEKTNKKSIQQMIFNDFIELVQKNYKNERKLEFYADKLSITPKHLSRVIKEHSMSTASEWIDNYVILEAKALLKSTTMTVVQISDELNFSDNAFFARYFRRHVGMSPKEYRTSL